jgi:transcriptional regulator with XRE-family HTH domain
MHLRSQSRARLQIDKHSKIANQGYMEPSRDEIRRWIRDILSQTGQTPSALARKAGIASTTLTRFLNEQDRTVLSFRSISKIAHAAGVPPIGLNTAQPRSSAEDAVPYDGAADLMPSRMAAIQALISDRAAASLWLVQSHALENAGYLPGDILIVDLSRKPEAGDVTCVQVYQWSKGKADTVFRIFEPPYLVAVSHDPSIRKPLLLDNERVIIKGVVTEMLRFSRP